MSVSVSVETSLETETGPKRLTLTTPTYVRQHRVCDRVDKRKQSYVDGPITQEQWLRFTYYAQFVHIFRHSARENVSSSVFFFLQQHSHGKPLFPRLRVVIWAHAVSDILSILSPTIRVLRFPFATEDMDNYGFPMERGHRVLRHAFKTLLPTILQRLLELRVLDLRPLRHANFWYGLVAPEPEPCFVAQSVRTLHVTEPLPTLLKGALAVISTIEGLEELRIVTNLPLQRPGATRAELMALEWPGKESVHPFASLRSLHVNTGVQEIALLMDIVVAPNLEDVTLHCMVYPTGRRLTERKFAPPGEVDALHSIVNTLCDRCAHSLQTVKLQLFSFKLPELSFEAVIKPLLQLHRLQELLVDVWFVQNAPVVLPIPDMLAAWPMLQRLNIPVLSLSPGDLQTVARICPELRSIRVMRLSDAFLELPDASATIPLPVSRHPLHEIRLYFPSKVADPANVTKIARFLSDVFPGLRAKEGVRSTLAKSRYFNQKNWHEILRRVVELQGTRAVGKSVYAMNT